MSIPGMLRSRALGDIGGPRPLIVPTRRRLDRRFAALGFTISTNQPWVEVLVATDPKFFDPEHSAARTPNTFYASRSHGGLTATTTGRARYIVPAGVVERLSGTASALWYLAIAYPDATGSGGVTSSETGASGTVLIDASVRHLPMGRRAVSLGRGFGRSTGLGDTDRMGGEDGADVALVVPVSVAQNVGGPLPAEDRLEGEDGADLAPTPPPTPPALTPPALPVVAPTPAPPSAEPAPSQPAPVNGATNGATNGSSAPYPITPAADLDYDDGWDRMPIAAAPALSAVPALADEYPDIDWGDVEVDDDYGRPPSYQSLEDGAVNGAAVPGTRLTTLPQLELSPEVQRRIIEQTVGEDGSAYAAINADGPYRGRHGPGHKAYQRFHTGLSFGIAEFNQDSGTLGQLLRLMHDREPETFVAIFGDAASELLAVTTAPGPSGEHGEGDRGPRVQPVAGSDLWEEPWASRFRAAGAVPAFRAAQNQLTAELYLAPLLPVAAGFLLGTERALCMVLDRAIALGEQGAKRWLADTVGPVKTPALRHDALAALGFDSIEAFQASVPGLLTDGEFGPLTHSALTAALHLSGRSPIPLPEPRTSVDLMAQRGRNEEGASRLVRLAVAPELSDAPIGP